MDAEAYSKSKWAANRLEKTKIFLEKGFELFTARSIEAVNMIEVAEASGHGIATLYRYFSNKAGFAVAISEWKWGEFFEANKRRRPRENFEGMTAADMFDFYLDSFLETYRNYRDLLRFNQLFNIYLRAEAASQEHVEAYRGLLQPVTAFFHAMYEKGLEDQTIRTDIPEEEMLSTTVHLMLAVVTRYAVGLVYQPKGGFDPEKELETLKEILIEKYTKKLQ